MSKSKPASLRALPPAAASFSPVSDSSTSVQPVNRLSLFHSDSPWRMMTSFMVSSLMHGLLVCPGTRVAPRILAACAPCAVQPWYL